MQERVDLEDTHQMCPEEIAAYLQWEREQGASQNALRRYRSFTASLYQYLPADKVISRQALRDWRHSLQTRGYSPDTERNYVKGINRYLDYVGCSHMRFNRGRPRDIAGQTFGYLTALHPTDKRSRKDIVWVCQCKCGKTVEIPATRLLTGNTRSCGCLLAEHLKKANQFFGSIPAWAVLAVTPSALGVTQV